MKLITLSAAILTLTACSGPMGKVGRIWPDGSSVWIGEINMQASMTGSGSMVLRDVRWTGTKGYPIPGTNSPSAK